MMSEIPSIKVNVEVNADFRSDGVLIPASVVWEDGCRSMRLIKLLRFDKRQP